MYPTCLSSEQGIEGVFVAFNTYTIMFYDFFRFLIRYLYNVYVCI